MIDILRTIKTRQHDLDCKGYIPTLPGLSGLESIVNNQHLIGGYVDLLWAKRAIYRHFFRDCMAVYVDLLGPIRSNFVNLFRTFRTIYVKLYQALSEICSKDILGLSRTIWLIYVNFLGIKRDISGSLKTIRVINMVILRTTRDICNDLIGTMRKYNFYIYIFINFLYIFLAL